MTYIDPHVHMSSRTTDDYQAMRAAGVVAVYGRHRGVANEVERAAVKLKRLPRQ